MNSTHVAAKLNKSVVSLRNPACPSFKRLVHRQFSFDAGRQLQHIIIAIITEFQPAALFYLWCQLYADMRKINKT